MRGRSHDGEGPNNLCPRMTLAAPPNLHCAGMSRTHLFSVSFSCTVVQSHPGSNDCKTHDTLLQMTWSVV